MSQVKAVQVPKEFQWPEVFDPTKGCSHLVTYVASDGQWAKEEAEMLLSEIMEAYVPEEYRKFVTYADKGLDYGRIILLSWRYDPPGRKEDAA